MVKSATPKPSRDVDALDRFFVRLEGLSQAAIPQEAFWSEWSRGLVASGIAAEGAAWSYLQQECQRVSATHGYPLVATDRELQSFVNSEAARLWVLPERNAAEKCGSRLLIKRHVATDVTLVLDLHCDDLGTDADSLQREEVAQGLSEIAGLVLLKQTYHRLCQTRSDEPLVHRLFAILCDPQGYEKDCREIAEALLRTTSVDRVSVCRCTGQEASVVAIVPASHFDRRSEQVQQLQKFVSRIAMQRLDGHFRVGAASALEDSVQGPLDDYLAASPSREVYFASSSKDLSNADQAFSYLVLERFTLGLLEESDLVRSAIRTTLPALHQCGQAKRSVFERLIDRVKTSSTQRRVVGGLVVVGLILALLAIIPYPFYLPAEGELQPAVRRRIFAPETGVLGSLLVEHGQHVVKDQPLIQMRHPERELEQKRLQGELETAETKLHSLRATKAQGERVRDLRDAESMARLSAQEEDLKIQIEGLQRELDFVSKDLARLILRSPLDGTVEGWEAARSLDGRPVQQGHYLFDVVDASQGWDVRLEIPDRFIGYVLQAQSNRACPVQFRIRSEPTVRYVTSIDNVDSTTQINENGVPYVMARAKLAASSSNAPRSGARIVARVDCGYRSIGFVWFREFIDLFRRNFWI